MLVAQGESIQSHSAVKQAAHTHALLVLVRQHIDAGVAKEGPVQRGGSARPSDDWRLLAAFSCSGQLVCKRSCARRLLNIRL